MNIKTKQLENGIWCAWDTENKISTLAITEQQAIDFIKSSLDPTPPSGVLTMIETGQRYVVTESGLVPLDSRNNGE